MADSIYHKQFTEGMLLVLEETFENVHGIFLDKGTSLLETLETITAEEASVPVGGKCATLVAQVKHTAFYLEIVQRYVQTGQNEKVDWGEIWRNTRTVNAEEWAALKTHLREVYAQTRVMVQSMPDWGMEDAMGGAIGLVAHTAYHLGEIRQALCTLR
jgi:hypothetical protein